MSSIVIFGAIQQGFLYAILAFGIYISFRVLNIPDLTTEGTFTFGLAVSAAVTAAGHPLLAILAAVAAGALAGAVTGFLQTKLLIHPVLAGIITMSGLYSINLAVLGSSNLALTSNMPTVFKLVSELGLSTETTRTVLSVAACLICLVLVIWFFRTHVGMCIRATGDNSVMVRASSIDVDRMITLGLCLSNGLVALSGGLIAQYQKFADISSGTGTLVVGLASVIIGEAIIGKRSVTVGFLSALLGAMIYRFIYTAAINYSPFPAYMLKLVSAIIVAIALAIPAFKFYAERAGLRKGAGRDA